MKSDIWVIPDYPRSPLDPGITFIPGISYTLHRQAPPNHLSEMDSFEYNSAPSRVIFGSGELKKLPAELDRLKLISPLLLSTPRQRGLIDNLKDNRPMSRIEP